MMYTGDAILGVGLSVQTPKPIDDRLVVSNKEDLKNFKTDRVYKGMQVADASTGNVYVLVDAAHPSNIDSWACSYEAIQFKTCTYAEYKEWEKNTLNYLPIDPNKDYLIEDVYYYIEEDSISDDDELKANLYLNRTWGLQVESKLTSLTNSITNAKLDAIDEIISKNYATEQHVADNYVPLSFLNGAEGGLTAILENYYTKEETDTIFVKKEDLGEDFKFVTEETYNQDKEVINLHIQDSQTKFGSIEEELANCIKSDGSGALDALTLSLIKSKEEDGKQLIVDIKPDGLYIEKDKIVVKSDIDPHQVLTKSEYDALVENTGDNYLPINKELPYLNANTYYHIIEDEETLDYYVLKSYLTNTYYDKSLTLQLISSYVLSYTFSKEEIQNLIKETGLDGNTSLLEILKLYYTIESADEKFATKSEVEAEFAKYVTIESLKEDEDFIFVEKSNYETDKEEITTNITNLQNEKANKVDLAKSISTEEVNTPIIKNEEGTLTLDKDAVKHNNLKLAKVEDVPVLVTVTKEEYDNIEEKDPNIYYHVYNTDENFAYVTAEELLNYYTKSQTEAAIFRHLSTFLDQEARDQVNALIVKVEELEKKLALVMKAIKAEHPDAVLEEVIPEEPTDQEPTDLEPGLENSSSGESEETTE